MAKRYRYKMKKNKNEGLIRKVFSFVVFIATLLLIILFGYQYLNSKGFFPLREVLIKGNHRVSRVEIIKQAGLKAGINLLALDKRKVEELLRRHPWLKEAHVTWEFPDKLKIEVIERHPFGIIAWDRLYLIDKEGIPFTYISLMEYRDYDLPIITGVDKKLWKADKRLFTNVLEILKLCYQAQKGSILRRVSEIHFKPHLGFSLFLMPGGVEVDIGWSQFTMKLNALVKVYEYLKSKGDPFMQSIAYIRLQEYPKIVIRPRWEIDKTMTKVQAYQIKG